MLFCTFCIVPYTVYHLNVRQKELYYLHPGQLFFKGTLIFEFVILLFCTVIFVLAEAKHSFIIEQFATMTFYIVLNVLFLLLCYALGLKETFEGEERFKGLINSITVIVFSSCFFIIWFILLIYVCLNSVDY